MTVGDSSSSSKLILSSKVGEISFLASFGIRDSGERVFDAISGSKNSKSPSPRDVGSIPSKIGNFFCSSLLFDRYQIKLSQHVSIMASYIFMQIFHGIP